ncbi:MAG: heavy metal translocating P-type ATPase, partial [Candidatus Ornithospirochaeta sp.]
MKKKEYKVSIDCADCALEVEEMLNGRDDVKNAVFNYAKGTLTLETSLSDDEIKKICRETEEDMEFLENEEKAYVFSVEIDCADCARKVEEELKKTEGVEKAFFDFPKGKLHVSTTLTEKEIMKICRSVEDEIVFHSSSLEEKKDFSLYRIGISIVLVALSYILGFPFLAVTGYIVSGYDVLMKAMKNIARGKVFDENFLMTAATIAALGVKNFEEAAAVMVFYQIGEYFQNRATRKSRESIGKLLDLSADTVTVKKGDEWIDGCPEEIEEGSLIMVKGGEKIALDGIVEEGSGFLDTRALTGESMPVSVKKGDKVLSGSVNGESTLIIRTTSVYAESTATKIMKLVEEGEGKKAESEKFITVFSRYYTPFVCISALLLALISPLFGITWTDSIYRAAMLLVISCPCALVLSVPLTYFASMGA